MKRFSLSQYTTLASVFLLIKSTDASIIYTDIDPDIIIDEQDETYVFDIDNNGIDDFYIFKGYVTFTTTTYYGSPGFIYSRKIQWIGPFSFENGVAGSNVFFTEPYGGSFSRYYPYALELGQTISNVLDFQNWGYQRIAFKSYVNYGIPWDEGGNWFPEMEDHYFGIKFLDFDDKNHFGWIRCSVIDSAKVLIIKDYAYETEIDLAIHAGEEYSEIDTPEVSNPIIYSSANTIYIQIQDTISATKVQIYNMTGQLVYENKLVFSESAIKFDSISGVYIVTLIQNGSSYSQKLYLF